MEVTNIEHQQVALKNKVETFFVQSIQHRKKKGICITRDVMSVLMDKWSLFVMYNLAYYGTLRFTQLKKNIPKISSRMLSVSLKKLEDNNILSRKSYNEVPPKVEYQLTTLGSELADKSVDLNNWLLEKYKAQIT